MSFVERLHPRDGDGKFAHEPGGGSTRVVSRQRGGPAVQHAPAAGGSGAPVWSGSGLRHVGSIGGSEYHLKRAGGVWSVFHGHPDDKRKVATAGSIAEAKAAAHAHAASAARAPAAPAKAPEAPAKATEAPAKAEAARAAEAAAAAEAAKAAKAAAAAKAGAAATVVRSSARPALASPTTAAKVDAARRSLPTGADGWDRAAKPGGVMPVDAASGLRMPSAELYRHLDSVVDAGRSVLADARREADRTAGPQIAAARDAARQAEHALNSYSALDQMGAKFRAGHPPMVWAAPDGTEHRIADLDAQRALNRAQQPAFTAAFEAARKAHATVAAHEQQVLTGVLGRLRGFGGVHHNAVAVGPKARPDSAQRVTEAEGFFPDAWLTRHAAHPLRVGKAQQRAEYATATNEIRMSTVGQDKAHYDGGFRDETAQINVHEFGHRMEVLVPGLSALEFALVRRRATGPDGTVQPLQPLGVAAGENGQPDEWRQSYAGKSYEKFAPGKGPHEVPWEVFQVGLEDTFGRSTKSYGRKSDPDELQAFVIGALLTLG